MSVDIEKVRRELVHLRGGGFNYAATQVEAAITELEQLRDEVAELKEERKDWGKDPDEYRMMSQCQMELMGRVEDYRAVLAALVDALYMCQGGNCPEFGTMVFCGADGDESYYCKAHATMGSEQPVQWANELNAALRLLGREP